MDVCTSRPTLLYTRLQEAHQSAIDNGEGRYVQGDYHGISGLEYQYERLLRGDKGERWVYRDRLGREVGEVLEGRANQTAEVGAELFNGYGNNQGVKVEEIGRNFWLKGNC